MKRQSEAETSKIWTINTDINCTLMNKNKSCGYFGRKYYMFHSDPEEARA